jgi:hypothetical protein
MSLQLRSLLLLALCASPLAAQTSEVITFQRTFLLRNVSGTASNPGPAPHHPILWERGAWTGFFEGAAFATYVSESGPKVQRNEAFSTNWFAGGVQRAIGRRGLVLVRARGSLEPQTIKNVGYPQLLQVVSEESGGPLVDRMRQQEQLQEAAVDLAFRTSSASFLHLYAAPVGDPPLGAVPFEQRASSEEFAEGPFAYDLQESWHYAKRVVTAGFSTPWVTLEGGMFRADQTSGDSSAVRLTVSARNASLQLSRGKLGDADLEVSSASLSYGSQNAAASVIYTKRELRPELNLSSLAVEGVLRAARNSIMARVETVDRPPEFVPLVGRKRTTHFTVGYLFDVVKSDAFRTGVGVNIDYHTATRELESRYGHKPQSIYAFVRVRTDSARR